MKLELSLNPTCSLWLFGLMDSWFSLPRSKCCNLIGWWSVKISWSWHLEVPRRYFLTLDTQQSKGRNANNGSHIVARNDMSTHIYYERYYQCNFIACFQIICWFLQTLNNRGNEKYVLVLIQCHDGTITNPINLFSHTQWVSVTLAIRLCPSSSSSSLSSLSSSSAWTFQFFDFSSQTAAQICFKFCVDVPWVNPY